MGFSEEKGDEKHYAGVEKTFKEQVFFEHFFAFSGRIRGLFWVFWHVSRFLPFSACSSRRSAWQSG